ncbi:MAG: PadR family transcriptional regulator [Micromonosporaceae bacterium]|nr:PadR family transcriptional regulator [Micromonosporaceae bacterium]
MDELPGLTPALRRGTLEFCVLALVETEQRYGVELVRRLAAEPALATSEGTLYPLLARLRRAGWIATTWQESAAGPPRRYYHLTAAGKEALARFRLEWRAFSTAVDRIVGREQK